MNAPDLNDRKTVPFDFGPSGDDCGLRIPKGCRVFKLGEEVIRVHGPNGATRIFVHPDDVAAIRTAHGMVDDPVATEAYLNEGPR